MPSREQLPDDLRESLGVAEAPEFEMLSKGGVFMQSDEVGESPSLVYTPGANYAVEALP